MNHNQMMRILIITFIIIVFMCMISIGRSANGKSKSEWLSDNPCMIKQIITEKTICLDKECLISETKVEEWPEMLKEKVALKLVKRILEKLK